MHENITSEYITGDWRKLYNQKLHYLWPAPTKCYYSGQIKMAEMGRTCGTYGGENK